MKLEDCFVMVDGAAVWTFNRFDRRSSVQAQLTHKYFIISISQLRICNTQCAPYVQAKAICTKGTTRRSTDYVGSAHSNDAEIDSNELIRKRERLNEKQKK